MVDSKQEDDLTDDASRAIMEAHFLEMRLNCTPDMLEAVITKTSEAWKKGSQAHYNLAKAFAKENDSRGMIYFLSAANCALKGNHLDLANSIITDLDACHFVYNSAQRKEYNQVCQKLAKMLKKNEKNR